MAVARHIRDLPQPVAQLFADALRLIHNIEESGGSNPTWSFGGGTVLMLRHGHRRSKDIDIFMPDPQYLGYVNPRLSTIAESITSDYVESADSIKLILPIGEIDFIASPNLTPEPFETWDIEGEDVRVETAAEIVAKKMWYRGGRVTARDLFDLAMIAEEAPEQIEVAAPWFERHKSAFLSQIQTRTALLEAQFNAIDKLAFDRSYDECLTIVSRILGGRAP